MGILTPLTVLIFLLVSPVSLLAGTCWNGGSSGSSPWNVLDGAGGNPSVAQVDVNYCINTVASAGDTINIPAGSATWTTYTTQQNLNANIHITKGITIQGAGITNTIVTQGANAWAFQYIPSDFTLNNPFRITGITFNINSTTKGAIRVTHHSSDLTIQTKIRIDHNKFLNGGTGAIGVRISGMRGVIDNNIFDGFVSWPLGFFNSYSNGETWWDNWEGIVYGKADNNIYVEDNIFQNLTGELFYSQYANRVALRYNTITTSGGSYPFMDMHGNQGATYMYSMFGGEIYGNKINMIKGQILDQRGGKVVLHHNTVIGATGTINAVKVREEVWDGYNPTTNTQPQHVSDSYYWNNRKNYNSNLVTSYLSQNVCSDSIGDSAPICSDITHGYSINENDEWYQDSAAFNGTVGIGCGTLASRPATCTTGVGYWATNQSCSDLTGLVGDSTQRTDGINTYLQGTLYKCTATNTWTPYYTPYNYPHPLRGEGITPPSVIFAGHPSNPLVCTSNPRDVLMSINTDQAATCKWSITDQAYADMPNTFSTTGGTYHSTTLSSLSCLNSYNRYVRCTVGASPNTESYPISFSLKGFNTLAIGAGSQSITIGGGSHSITW